MPSRFYPDPIEGLTPGTIIITEETVENMHGDHTSEMGGDTFSRADLLNQSVPNDFIPPIDLEVLLNGKPYILKCAHKNKYDSNYFYGDFDALGFPVFDNNPVALRFRMSLDSNSGRWMLATPEPGTYTVSAKISEEKSTPKVLSFPKGRTIVSELSRLNKAFGTVSKKKTIIGQLSDIADAAEAGKIGGGSGEALMVRVNGMDIHVLDKTWQKIHDALKTTSVYIISENEEEMSVSTQERIIEAYNNPDGYGVHTSLDNYYTTASPDDYPAAGGK